MYCNEEHRRIHAHTHIHTVCQNMLHSLDGTAVSRSFDGGSVPRNEVMRQTAGKQYLLPVLDTSHSLLIQHWRIVDSRLR